ncbi:MAG: RNA-binding protein [Pyrinomonadaceae bacterium]|nr:RNA-binding protein [Pyrinomonadaceae bacterium]
MSMKLYVGNLSFQTSSEDLQQLFAQAGTVESASVVEDRETGRSRGFGFVEMSSNEEGQAAISQFNGKEINGRSLTVNEARPREDRGGNRGGGGGGGRGGYGGGGGRGSGGGVGRGGYGGGGGGGGNREPRW